VNGGLESFGYALLTAAVGMAIVFFFLVVLSLMMRVIRYLFDPAERARPAGGAPPARDADQEQGAHRTGASASVAHANDGAGVVDAHGIPRWAIAAALAYLSEEERAYSPAATGWTYRVRQSGRAL
jgi:Na+-transporting methylmalonyl-CoA/oxaloacetate decarboxylase gamma subunit